MKKEELVKGKRYHYSEKEFFGKREFIYCGINGLAHHFISADAPTYHLYLSEKSLKKFKLIKKEGHPATTVFKLND